MMSHLQHYSDLEQSTYTCSSGTSSCATLCSDLRSSSLGKCVKVRQGTGAKGVSMLSKNLTGYVEVINTHTHTHIKGPYQIGRTRDFSLHTVRGTVMHCQSAALQLFDWRNKKGSTEQADE